MTQELNAAEIAEVQKDFCTLRGLEFVASPLDEIVGLARSSAGETPMNGLRHPLTSGTTGWYVWFGTEMSQEPDFFVPTHAWHVYEEHKELAPLLGLPPGYRFLLAGEYLDVWFDNSLLKIDLETK